METEAAKGEKALSFPPAPSMSTLSKTENLEGTTKQDGATTGSTYDFTNKSLVLETLGYHSCIETNDPTPFDVATKRLKTMLLRLSQLGPQEKEEMEASFIGVALLPVDEIIKTPLAGLDIEIRTIEVQILLRIQFLSSLGKKFLRLYNAKLLQRQPPKLKRSEKKKSKKQKSKGFKRRLLNDIDALLSMAAMKLPESRPFATFLNGVLDTRISKQPTSLLPNGIFQELYDRFEIHNPENPPEEDYVPMPVVKASKPKKLVKTEKPTANGKPNVSSATLNAKDQPKCDGMNDNNSKTLSGKSVKRSFFSRGPSLVAPTTKKRNFLGGASRSQYIGSHFGTKHSNFDTLFREVKTLPKKTKRASSRSSSKGQNKQALQVNSKPASISTKPSKVDAKHASLQSQTTNAKRRQSQCFNIADGMHPNKKPKPVIETPSKKGDTKSKRKQIQSARQAVLAARYALQRQR